MIIDLKKYTIQILAAILVVALGYMAITLIQKQPTLVLNSFENEIENIEYQSTSDTIKSIEKDLDGTELDNIDAELLDIEKELEASLQ